MAKYWSAATALHLMGNIRQLWMPELCLDVQARHGGSVEAALSHFLAALDLLML